MNTDILAVAAPGFWELSVVLLLCLPMYILPLVALWKICARVGFPGALGLLWLVPIANVVLLLYIAFAEWPVLKDRGS